MGRGRKGRPINGWVILDKDPGMTSTNAVSRVRRIFDANKAGHAGTLDPAATGILPIALGEATKTMPYIVDSEKQYRFTVTWGAATNTDDAEGEVIAENAVRPGRDAIEAALPGFTGSILQIPPRFSAIKVNGKRAYAMARKDETVALQARKVEIHELVLEDIPDPDHARLRMRCGKGTYVRSVARDLAVHLGTVGHVRELRRLAVGPFRENAAISLAALDGLGHSAASEKGLLPVETALDDIPALAVTESEAVRLRSGQPVSMLRRSDRERHSLMDNQGTAQGGLVCAMWQGRVIAITRRGPGELRPIRVLNQ